MIWSKLFNKNKNPASKRELEDDEIIISGMTNSGMVDGKHYTQYAEDVKELKRNSQNKQAIELLLRLVAATENEAKAQGSDWGVAPWYYEQLAIIYRKEKMYDDEISIINRYINIEGKIGPGYESLSKRLKKAKSLKS